MSNFYSNPTLSNVTFSGNSAEFGGAMYNRSSSPQLTNVTFSGNSANIDGGAMYNLDSNPTLSNVTFSGNSATRGGAMFNFGDFGGSSSPQLTNVTFSGNSATRGGAMFNFGDFVGSSSPQLTNVTFSGNAASIGGAMFNVGDLGGSSSPQLTNVIVWGNTAGLGTQMYNNRANPVLNYTLIQNGANDIFNDSSTVTYGPGMVSSDPLFVAPITATVAPTTTGNYRLGSNSPAIDAGLNSAIALLTDLDGNTRFYNDAGVADTGSGSPPIVDMGAYERQSNSSGSGSKVYLPIIVKNN
jgi:hypothetical protein